MDLTYKVFYFDVQKFRNCMLNPLIFFFFISKKKLNFNMKWLFGGDRRWQMLIFWPLDRTDFQ